MYLSLLIATGVICIIGLGLYGLSFTKIGRWSDRMMGLEDD